MAIDIQDIKQRYGIVGNNSELNHAITKALQIASTDLPVLITGESGVGKESFPKLIHDFSPRKHKKYVVVNCGAIPEGTMDSELFGHIKGSFTGALADRQGYFEVADGGTIFLDEVGELPLQTQARLLRVLQYGEYYRVGSSDVRKTDVRVVAATNVNLLEAIRKGTFRQDLYYRLNAIPIYIPPLRERKKDIHILFKKFANDFAEKYHRIAVKLDPKAVEKLKSYYWQGNIRQLKNVAEQISAIEMDPNITVDVLSGYLPDESESRLPQISGAASGGDFSREREFLYTVIYSLKGENDKIKQEIEEIKKTLAGMTSQHGGQNNISKWQDAQIYSEPIETTFEHNIESAANSISSNAAEQQQTEPFMQNAQGESSQPKSMDDMQKQMILDSLRRHNNKRALVAAELGISERTLYRKLKEYGI